MTLKPSGSIRIFNPRPDAAMRLVCFPYAGGSAQIYKAWGDIVAKTGAPLELCAVQLPGRAGRFREPRFTSVDAAVTSLLVELEALRDKPFAFYGHSLGAALAYEAAYALERRGHGPRHVVVSGMMSPPNPSLEPAIYHLPDAEFRDKLREFEGTPQEILQHEELMDLMVPLLRADFTMADTYSYHPGRVLTCPLTVHGGLRDPHTDEAGLRDWQQYTTGAFACRLFDGDHFFINVIADQVLADVTARLNLQP